MVEIRRAFASVQCCRLAKSLVVLTATAIALCPSAQGALLSPFNWAEASLFGNLDQDSIVSSQTGPVSVTIGAVPTAFGRARAGFGSNGVAGQVGGPGTGTGLGSIWSDGFIFTGGTGTLKPQISVGVDGSITGGVDMSYALFVSTSPFDVQNIIDAYGNGPGFDFDPAIPGTQRLLYTAVANDCGNPNVNSAACGHVPLENFQGPLDVALSEHDFPFTFGVTYYFASVFSEDVHAETGGNGNFFNSASFGISVPAGVTLTTLSDTVYPAAVPEPTTLALLAVAALGFVGCRHKARGTTGARKSAA